VTATRRSLQAAVRSLARRSAEVRALTAEAEAARDSLAAAEAERRSYLAELARRERLNARAIARLSARAAEVEAQAQEVAAATSAGAGPATAPLATSPAPPAAGGTLTVTSTGYALPGTTATGLPVGWGVVAVDPGVIPLGTRMTIPGYGEGVAADTGSAVRGATIDLWFPTTGQALEWGRRTVTITFH
jgi:cystine transport system substrate-binding protein